MIPVLLVVFLISILIGCGETTKEAASSIKLIPQKADIVGHVDLGRILSNSDLIELYDKLPKEPDNPQTFDEAIDTAIEEMGIDPRDVDEAFLFGDTSTATGESDYFGVILIGSINIDDIINAIERDALLREDDVDFDTVDYKGYELYIDADQTAALVSLGDDMTVIGTVEPVKDVIDVQVGDEQALTGEVLDSYTSFGNVLVKAAASVSSETMEDAVNQATEFLPVPIDLSSLVNIETAELTVDEEGESINLYVELCFTDKNSAKAVKGLVTLAKAMVDMIDSFEDLPGDIEVSEESQASLSELLNMLDTEVVEDCLTISLDITFEELEALYSEQE
jgi:hypothetical protein